MKHMKSKRVVFYLLGSMCLVILAFWISQGAIVQGQPLMDYFLPSGQDTSVPMQEQPRNQPQDTQPPSKKKADYSKAESTELEILEQVKVFNGLAREEYLQPGWLHISQFKKAFVTAMDSFTDGTPIPTEEWIDSWYLLAEDGEVLKSVTISDTGDPKTTQIVVYQDKIFTNLTFPNLKSSEQEESFLTSLDHGLSAKMLNNPGMDVDLEHFEEIDSVVITTSTYFDEPVTYESQITASGYSYVYRFDPETGVVMLFEDNYLDQDGDPVLRVRLETLSCEILASPPDDILQYFD